jgi:uncharacterized protein YggE
MEKESVREIIAATHWPRMMAAVALGVLALFLLVGTAIELKQYHLVGSGVTATNTINVQGEGDVSAVPDTATFTATIQEDAKEVKTAQDTATKKSNEVIAYLKKEGIDAKDIQTADYSVYPKYEYSQKVCVAGEMCPPGTQVLTGYTVSQTITVKVRDTSKAGDLLSGVGSRGISQVSGLNFTIDNEDALKAQARDKAIAQAKAKAEVLAKSLGVSLIRIVNFSEDTNGRAYPVMYSAKADSMGMGGGVAAPSPEIPTGENKITSNVSVTYEIQ